MGSGDDEILQLFIEESQEHLAGIEDDLLSIEGGGSDVAELINKVFRAVHSVKGAAGFFGLNRISELSHVSENVLGMMRNNELDPSSEVIGRLLSALDLLRSMIEDVGKSESIEIASHVADLQRIIDGDSSPSTEPAQPSNQRVRVADDAGNALVVNAADIKQAQSQAGGGDFLYIVTYDLLNDVQRKNLNPLRVLEELDQIAILITSTVDLDAIGTLETFSEQSVAVPWRLLVSSDLERADFAPMFDVAPEQVRPATIVGTVEESANAATATPDVAAAPAPVAAAPAPVAAAPAPVAAAPAPVAAAPAPVAAASRRRAASPAPGAAPVAAQPAQPVAVYQEQSASFGGDPSVPQADQQTMEDTSTPSGSSAKRNPADGTLRVKLHLLDRLMTLAGELVLTRNQLLQNVEQDHGRKTIDATQRIDLITTELQDAIMSTRMQSIGIVFQKVRRMVRDLSTRLGKDVTLALDGEDVEVDKTIIEAISDPITHLVRNALDHGVETPQERQAAGKKTTGHIRLSAYHMAGQVVIEIADDGKGIDPARIKAKALSQGLLTAAQLDSMSEQAITRLILRAGFSTAEKVTDVSGRGVGMDVVHSNLTRIGGVVDIRSEPGKGTTVKIKLPLTLAIIPALLVEEEKETYAIPQASLVELHRIAARDVRRRIERLGGVDVMRVRGELLPIVRLRDVLGINKTFPASDHRLPDRRENIADRRGNAGLIDASNDRRQISDRRASRDSALNVAVVAAGDLHFGIIVERLQDSSEIVVKPLGQHVKSCACYAGATILGNGKPALILDITGISRAIMAEEKAEASAAADDQDASEMRTDSQTLLLLENAPGSRFAVPVGLVERIIRIQESQVQMIARRRTMTYNGHAMRLFAIEDVISVDPRPTGEDLFAVIYRIGEREVALLVANILDIVDTRVEVDESTLGQPGIFGSLLLDDQIVLLLDLYAIAIHEMPEKAKEIEKERARATQKQQTILVVEDSKFFLNKIRGFVEEAGYQTLTAEDGVQGLEVLAANANAIDLILTDIEMPRMDGFTMTERVRADSRWTNIPVIAVTSVMGEEAERRGRAVGIDEYMIKLDREQILERSRHFLEQGRTGEQHAATSRK